MASVDRRQSVSAVDKKTLEAFRNGHKPFVLIRHTLPMQYVLAFLDIALDEGLGVTEYAKKARVSQSVMSRHLLDLGDKARDGGPGYGLVTSRQDPLNLRRHQVMLTDKRRAMVWDIVREMGMV
jgi:DNA-binding MarR family transcriptional regulator